MPDSIYLIICIIGIAIVAAVEWYARWETWNDYRKLERRAHVNLYRQGGEWWS